MSLVDFESEKEKEKENENENEKEKENLLDSTNIKRSFSLIFEALIRIGYHLLDLFMILLHFLVTTITDVCSINDLC
jgi:hypothetical protein